MGLPHVNNLVDHIDSEFTDSIEYEPRFSRVCGVLIVEDCDI
jgi:hypothetical protein